MKTRIIAIAILFVGCNSPKLMKDKVGVVIFSFEKAGIDGGEFFYFFKSSHLIINNNELDIERCFSEPYKITKNAKQIIEKKYGTNWTPKVTSIANTDYFTRSGVEYINDVNHYSDYIYQRRSGEKVIFI